MDLRALGLAVAAGISAFLIVGSLVTENLSAAIEFSLFLGVPAGTVAGIAAVAFVYLRLGATDRTTRRIAVAGSGFGIGFVAVAALGVILGARHSITLPLATAGGLAGTALTFVRYRD